MGLEGSKASDRKLSLRLTSGQDAGWEAMPFETGDITSGSSHCGMPFASCLTQLPLLN